MSEATLGIATTLTSSSGNVGAHMPSSGEALRVWLKIGSAEGYVP
ncbi:hypothetical protein [Roseomonas sp. BN140053]